MARGIIIGGGIIGLSIGRELHKRGYEIVVIDREKIGYGASWVAGGMLAPQAEGLKPGLFLDFCLESRQMYKDFVEEIKEDTGINSNYWKSGIFCPAFSEKEAEELMSRLTTYKTMNLSGQWIERKDLEKNYPSLGKEIIGGVLFEDDGQVDNRLLMKALRDYAIKNFTVKENTKVLGIEEKNGKFSHVKTDNGNIYGDFCVLSAGAWSGKILDIPVFPIKGEMAGVDIEIGEIDRVFFSSRAYIIPRFDYSRLVIGATEERVGFKDGNTVKGVLWLFKGLLDTFPHMKDRNIQEIWAGYRPGTTDLDPILGEYHIKNLYIATGHYRNGILLAPITAKLITDLIDKKESNRYLEAFSYKRFL